MPKLNRSVTLAMRITPASGKRRYCPPVLNKQGHPRPQMALVDGTPERHPEGLFYLRYSLPSGKRTWESVGKDPQMAYTALLKKQHALRAEQLAGPTLICASEPRRSLRGEASRKVLGRVAASWIAEATVRKSKRTGYIYGKTIEAFRSSCTKTFLDEVGREDITAFFLCLQQKGNSPRTVHNAAGYLRTFFRWAGLPDLIRGGDLPKYTEKAVTAYGYEEIKAMLRVANEDDRLFIQFLVGTGVREQEAMYCYYTDIDYDRAILTIRQKPEYGFRVKDREERSVPLPDPLVASLRARRDRFSAGQRLVFPAASTGGPDGHLIRRIKSLHLRAGLNCGHCVTKGGKRCDTRPVCRLAELHKTRRTYATMLSESGVAVQTISKFLGHADLETTIRYLQAADLSSERTRSQVNGSFASLSAA